MGKRMVMGVVVLAFAAVLAVETRAAAMGSLEITLNCQGQPIEGAEIALFRVGQKVTGGYQLTEEFGGGRITELDVMSPELAVFLSQKAVGGAVCRTNSQGVASFRLLEEGLYLVAQGEAAGGCQAIAPFLVIMPWDGYQWEISAAPHLVPLEGENGPSRDAVGKDGLSQEVPPETSDPGTVLWGSWGMALSSSLLALLLAAKRRLLP